MANIVEILSGKLPRLHDAKTLQDIVLYLVENVRRDEVSGVEGFFEEVERQIIFADRSTQDRVIVELLEGLKNQSCLEDVDYIVFENWLLPETHVAWRWLEKKWQGKRSLADEATSRLK